MATEQVRRVIVSAVAGTIYRQADKAELLCLCAMAFDTLGFSKTEYGEYNHLAAENYGVSLKTMQNRTSVVKKVQTKYTKKIAEFGEISRDSINSFRDFFTVEMKAAHGEFRFHTEDVGNFLDGSKPAHIQRAEQKEAETEAQKARQAMLDATKARELEEAKRKAELDAIALAETKAENEADISGAASTVPQAPLEEGTPVGIQSPDLVVNTDVKQAPVPHKPDVEPLVSAIIDKDGNVSIKVHDICDASTLADIIAELQQAHLMMVAEDKIAKAA